MASKIQSYDFYVAIKPYKIEGHEDEFNELSVYVSYDNRQKHFYVSLHAGWGNGSMHGCILYGGQGWLTDTQWVAVKDAPKNSQKTINEMGAAMEMAKELIGCLFDNRDYDKLEHAVKMIALHGYTEDFRRTAEEYINAHKTIDTTADAGKEDHRVKTLREAKAKRSDSIVLFRFGDFYEAYEEDAKECANILGIAINKCDVTGLPMAGFPHHALDQYLPMLIRAGKKVSICDYDSQNQNENKPETSNLKPETNEKEDKDMRLNMNANESGNVQNNAQVNNPAPATTQKPISTIEDAVFETVEEVEPTAAADGAESKVKGQRSKANGQTSDIKPQTSKAKPETLSPVRLITYTTKNGETAPRIVGFSGEDDPRWKPMYDEKIALAEAYKKAKKQGKKAGYTFSPFGAGVYTNYDTREKSYYMAFGVKYADVAAELCAAYNTTDRAAWAKAEANVRALKDSISETFKAEREARKAERKAKAEGRRMKDEGEVYTKAELAKWLHMLNEGTDAEKAKAAKFFSDLAKAA